MIYSTNTELSAFSLYCPQSPTFPHNVVDDRNQSSLSSSILYELDLMDPDLNRLSSIFSSSSLSASDEFGDGILGISPRTRSNGEYWEQAFSREFPIQPAIIMAPTVVLGPVKVVDAPSEPPEHVTRPPPARNGDDFDFFSMKQPVIDYAAQRRILAKSYRKEAYQRWRNKRTMQQQANKLKRQQQLSAKRENERTVRTIATALSESSTVSLKSVRAAERKRINGRFASGSDTLKSGLELSTTGTSAKTDITVGNHFDTRCLNVKNPSLCPKSSTYDGSGALDTSLLSIDPQDPLFDDAYFAMIEACLF